MKSKARRAGKLMSSTILCSSFECFELNGRGQTFKIVMHRYHFLEFNTDILHFLYISLCVCTIQLTLCTLHKLNKPL